MHIVLEGGGGIFPHVQSYLAYLEKFSMYMIMPLFFFYILFFLCLQQGHIHLSHKIVF